MIFDKSDRFENDDNDTHLQFDSHLNPQFTFNSIIQFMKTSFAIKPIFSNSTFFHSYCASAFIRTIQPSCDTENNYICMEDLLRASINTSNHWQLVSVIRGMLSQSDMSWLQLGYKVCREGRFGRAQPRFRNLTLAWLLLQRCSSSRDELSATEMIVLIPPPAR